MGSWEATRDWEDIGVHLLVCILVHLFHLLVYLRPCHHHFHLQGGGEGLGGNRGNSALP